MKMTIAKRCLVAVAAGVFSFSAFAQDDKAKSLEDLLQMVKQSKIMESKEHREREARFRSNKANQARELRLAEDCLLYTSPSPRDGLLSRMPSSA